MENIKELSVTVGSYEGLLLVHKLACSTSKKIAVATKCEQKESDMRLVPSFTVQDHSNQIKCCSCGVTGLVATGGVDEMIQVYDVLRRVELATLTQHQGTITSLAWLNHDEYLLSTGEDGLVCVWESKGWKLMYKMGQYRAPVSCISIHPNGTVALSVGKDKTLRTWNLQTGKNAYTTNLKFVCDRVIWSFGGKYYVLISQANVYIHSTQTTELVLTTSACGAVNDICSLNEEYLCIGDQSKDLKLVHIENREIRTLIPGAHKSRVKCVKYVAAHDLLITASTDGLVKLWSIDLTQMLDKKYEPALVAEYDTSCRITCIGFCLSKFKKTNDTGASTVKNINKLKQGKSKKSKPAEVKEKMSLTAVPNKKLKRKTKNTLKIKSKSKAVVNKKEIVMKKTSK